MVNPVFGVPRARPVLFEKWVGEWRLRSDRGFVERQTAAARAQPVARMAAFVGITSLGWLPAFALTPPESS
jgi:hypothetical protein